MRLHGRRGAQGRGVEAGFVRRTIKIGTRDTANEERTAIEFFAGGFKRLFGSLHIGVAKFVAQRGKRGFGAVVDGKDGAFALHATRGLHFVDALHRDFEHFRVGDAKYFDVEELAEGPAGVVIRGFLRIVGTPVLVIEERVGDAGIGLIHADHYAAGGEFARRRLSLLFLFVIGRVFSAFS